MKSLEITKLLYLSVCPIGQMWKEGEGWALQIGQCYNLWCQSVFLCAHTTTALTVWLKRCLHEYTNLFYRQTLFLQPGVMPGPGSVWPIMHISLSAQVARPGQSDCQRGKHWPTRDYAEENSAMKISLSAWGGAGAVSQCLVHHQGVLLKSKSEALQVCI